MLFRSCVLSCGLLLAVLVTACGGSSSSAGDSPTSPSGPALPAAGELKGHATDAITGKDLPGVAVSVTAGANVGKTAVTDSTGSFTLSGMDLSGSTTVKGTLAGYQDLSVVVTGTSQNVANLRMTPTGSTITDSTTDTLAPTDPPCAGSTGPCKAYSVTTHLQGSFDVTLTWTDPGVVLALELWRSGGKVADGVASGAQQLRLQTAQPAAAYEVRVRMVSGTKQTSYTVSGSRPS